MERHSYFPEADENIRIAELKAKAEKKRIENKELREKKQKKEAKEKAKAEAKKGKESITDRLKSLFVREESDDSNDDEKADDSDTDKDANDGRYHYSKQSPIFGKTGFHAGDKPEKLPKDIEDQDEKEKAKAEAKAEKERAAKEKEEQKEKDRLEKERLAKEEAEQRAKEKAEKERLKAEKEKDRKEQQKHIKDGFISLFGKDGYSPDKDSAADAKDTKTGASTEQEPTINPSGPEAAKEISNAIDQTLKQSGENLPKQIQAANPEVSSAEAHAIAEHLNQPDVKKSLGQRIKDKISDIFHGIKDRPGALTGGAAAGFGATMLSRSLLRNGIRFLLGGSFGAGIFAGAGAGGMIEGIRKIYREKHKVSADDILTQLTDTGKSDVERAILISKAQKALAEARVNDKSKVPELKAKIQAAQTSLVTKMNQAEFAGKPERDKIAFILKTSALERKNLNKDQKKEVKELMDKLKIKAEGKIIWKDVAKAAGKGALVGAVGGAIGGAVAGVISDFMHPDLAHDAIQHHIEALGGLKQHAYDSAIKQGSDKILGANYTETALHGEGLTHLARKGIHDLLTNAHMLNPTGTPNFTPEQLVYAEDYILKNDLLHQGVSSIVYPGQQITLSGAQIMDALNHAGGLNPVQLDSLHNLLNTPGHLLSNHTRELMMNFGEFADRANDLADPLMQGARNAAEQIGPEALTWFESPSTDMAKKYLWFAGLGIAAMGGAAIYNLGKKKAQSRVTPGPETPGTPPQTPPNPNAPHSPNGTPPNAPRNPGNTAPLPSDPNAPKNPGGPNNPPKPGSGSPERILNKKEKADIKAVTDQLQFVPDKAVSDQDKETSRLSILTIVESWKKNFDDDKFNKLVEKLKKYKISLTHLKMGKDKDKSVDITGNKNDVLKIADLYNGNEDEIAEQLTAILGAGVLDKNDLDAFKKVIEEKRAATQTRNNPPTNTTNTPPGITAGTTSKTGTTPPAQNANTQQTTAGAGTQPATQQPSTGSTAPKTAGTPNVSPNNPPATASTGTPAGNLNNPPPGTQPKTPAELLSEQNRVSIKEAVDSMQIDPEKKATVSEVQDFKKNLSSVVEFWRNTLGKDATEALVNKLKGYKIHLVDQRRTKNAKPVAITGTSGDMLVISATAPGTDFDKITQELAVTLNVLDKPNLNRLNQSIEAKKAAEAAVKKAAGSPTNPTSGTPTSVSASNQTPQPNSTAGSSANIEDFSATTEPSNEINNPSVLNTESLSSEELSIMEGIREYVEKIAEKFPANSLTNVQQLDSFKHDLEIIMREMLDTHKDLVQYLTDDIKFYPYVDSNDLSGKAVELNTDGGYNVNTYRTAEDIEAALIPILEGLRDADPNRVQQPPTTTGNVLNPNVNTQPNLKSPEELEKEISGEFPKFFSGLDAALSKAQIDTAAAKEARELFASFVQNIKDGKSSLEPNTANIPSTDQDKIVDLLQKNDFQFIVDKADGDQSDKISDIGIVDDNDNEISITFDKVGRNKNELYLSLLFKLS